MMMADPTWQYINHPHRKALPQHLAPYPSPTNSQNSNVYSHSRSRTTSSNTFPSVPNQNPSQIPYPANTNTMYAGTYSSRRSPSTNTFSTTASTTGPPNRAPSTELRRSTSSRSGGAPTSYVALMRKQKATVWCDRGQTSDPRLLAAQKAAKARAASEVSSSSPLTTTLSGRSSTGVSSTNRVAAKIRHHGKSGLTGYAAGAGDGNFGVGVGGVPMRLSASEVEGGDSDSDNERHSGSYSQGGMYHHRSGSGRSSIGSERRRIGLQYRQSGASGNSGRWSSGNTPPSGGEGRNGSGLSLGAEGGGSLTDLAEETPMPTNNIRQKDYFSSTDGPSHSHPVSTNRTQSTNSKTSAKSNSSGSSGERADAVGELGGGSDAARLASNSLLKSTINREKSTRSGGSTGPEELRRRGSVDDRTMTITGGVGRLFVANPDLSDDE